MGSPEHPSSANAKGQASTYPPPAPTLGGGGPQQALELIGLVVRHVNHFIRARLWCKEEGALSDISPGQPAQEQRRVVLFIHARLQQWCSRASMLGSKPCTGFQTLLQAHSATQP